MNSLETKRDIDDGKGKDTSDSIKNIPVMKTTPIKESKRERKRRLRKQNEDELAQLMFGESPSASPLTKNTGKYLEVSAQLSDIFHD